MFIVPSIYDGEELSLCLLGHRWSCWLHCWLCRLLLWRKARVDDSTGEGQYILRLLKIIVMRGEQLKHRSNYLSLLVHLQPKRLDAIDHGGKLKTKRSNDSNYFTRIHSWDTYQFLLHVFFLHLFHCIWTWVHRRSHTQLEELVNLKLETSANECLTWEFQGETSYHLTKSSIRWYLRASSENRLQLYVSRYRRRKITPNRIE